MDKDELQLLHDKLKCGEYDGADIMRAWIAIEELITIQSAQSLPYCMNCCHFKPVVWEPDHRGMGECNSPLFHFGYARLEDEQIRISGIVIEDDEGWGCRVGPNFGCRHFEAIE